MDYKDLIPTVLVVRHNHTYFLKKEESDQLQRLLNGRYSTQKTANDLIANGNGNTHPNSVFPLISINRGMEQHESPLELIKYCFDKHATSLHLFEHRKRGSIPLTSTGFRTARSIAAPIPPQKTTKTFF